MSLSLGPLGLWFPSTCRRVCRFRSGMGLPVSCAVFLVFYLFPSMHLSSIACLANLLAKAESSIAVEIHHQHCAIATITVVTIVAYSRHQLRRHNHREDWPRPIPLRESMVEPGTSHIPALALGAGLRAGHTHARSNPPLQCHRPVKKRIPSSNCSVKSARERRQMPQPLQLRALQMGQRYRLVKILSNQPRKVGNIEHIRMVQLRTLYRDHLMN